MKLCPSGFKARCCGDLSFSCRFLLPGVSWVKFYFFPLPAPTACLPLVDSPAYPPFLPSPVVASSLRLAVEILLCQSSVHFLAYLQWCGCYLVVSVGWDEVRVLLLGHLPRKFWYLYNIKWTDPQHRIYSIYSYNYLHTLVEFNIFEIWVLCIPHKDNSQVP